MKTFKKNWWKVILIIICSVFFDMILHALISPLNSSNISLLKPSIFVKNGMVVPAIIGWELLAFGVLALIFTMIQDNLPGNRRIKGFLYGLSFGGLYLIGMFESVLLFNSSLFNEFLMGLGDFVPILLMGILLGIFIGSDGTQYRKRQNVWSVLVIAILYIIGRYFAYSILQIESTYVIKPLGTFIWTLCQGLWVGIIFLILQTGIKGKSVISQGLFFGIVIFGSNWLTNHLFIAVISELSPDLFIRAGTDILFITVGAIVCNKLFPESRKES
ncbi:MAG: hypothetical protein K0R36_3784 [Chryseobacterium sp.]|jgi:hypothetical protein|nr:hypothetical protein [Chryseobacterium sp.]